MIMKSVLITGCSAGGIDAALCHEFHKRGFHVFAGARTILKLGDVETLTHVTPITLDVTDPSSIMAAVEAVRQRTGGRLDCLINNAGAQYVSPFLDMNIEAARAMYDVNVWGCMDMVQRFAPLIIPAKGSIVNIASISGYLYALFMSMYNGSKAALDMVSETLRLELAPFGVRVITCARGAIGTKFMTNSKKETLPPDSLYASIEHTITARARGDDVKNTSTPQDFAQRLVNDVISGATGHVYRGKLSSTMKLVTTWLQVSTLDVLLTRGTGLEELSGEREM